MTAGSAGRDPAGQALAALVPPGMHLLVSCFDADQTIGGGLFVAGAEPGRGAGPAAGDPGAAAGGEAAQTIDRVSGTGLHATGDRLVRCLWSQDGSPAELLVYDASGVLRYHRLDQVSAPHDVLAVDDHVLVVATNQNEVVWVGPDGAVTRRWRAPGEPDSWHLNSLFRHGERLLVSAFGQFPQRRGWDAAGRPASGCLVDVETGERVLDGLAAPHNPVFAEDAWLVCNSATGELVEIDPDGGRVRRRLDLPGWPRGLAVAGDRVFVGLSPHRHAASAIETARVVAVDRVAWRVVAAAPLPAREVYALALVGPDLLAGVRRGFASNATRTHEQGQLAMFDRVGVRPRLIWAVGDRLRADECRVSVEPVRPVGSVAAGALLTVACVVRNRGSAVLTPAPPYPVRVVYRWRRADGSAVETEQLATALDRSLPPGEAAEVALLVRAPGSPGRHRLRITVEQQGVTWFDELDDGNAVEMNIDVLGSAGAPEPGPVPGLGGYPGAVRAAREVLAAGGSPAAAVRRLLTRPDGCPDGLAVALARRADPEQLRRAVAQALGVPEDTARELLAEHTGAGSAGVVLTGAEAVAAVVAAAGARVAFAYAGTSELSVCDALARIPGEVLANGRGDRECAFLAGGASRLRPGNGLAVLHGARGLTNALGALADLRRNEVGMVAVVGLPSTGSAPFLPPHGEPDLVASAGRFTKAWYEAPAVPADPAERVAAAEAFVTLLHRAFAQARTLPYGPVLVGIPQDVLEAAWVPLTVLEAASGAGSADAATAAQVTVARAAAAQATAAPAGIERAVRLLAGARRVAILIDDYALLHEGLRPALARLSDLLRAPVLQVWYRRGPMLFERLNRADVPRFLGWLDPANEAQRKVLHGADVLVTVEDRNCYARVVGELPSCAKIAVTSNPAAVHKNRYLGPDDVLLDADIVAALEALAAAVPPAGDATDEPWYADALEPPPVQPALPEVAGLVRRGVAAAVARALSAGPATPVIVDDSQMFGGMLAAEYDLLPDGVRVIGDHGAFVGGGIAFATGLALGEPDARVLCCLGDQGLTNGLQGFVAAVQQRAPVTYLVCNNGGSVSLAKQAGAAGDGRFDDGRHPHLHNPGRMHYTELARAFGMPTGRADLTRVTGQAAVADRLARFERRLTDLLDQRTPALLELVLPAEPEFWTGVWITEGFEARTAVR
ncbi:MAG TPA: DUF4915 domain-containing protein [Micromonosporaceae bacterium]|nr:DUF4915 domain-containing protein [Micromonosporaceae bacterium]